MKITIKKLVFQSLVEKAGTIVSGSTRDILPVLKNFHIEAKGGSRPRLRVVATDMDLAQISDTELVLVDEAGEAIVPAKRLTDMVKEAGDTDITLQTDGETAAVSTPTTSWSMQLMKDQYPSIPEVTDVTWSNIDADQFAAGLKKVRNALSTDIDKRPELTLVRCGTEGIFASDGGRLHVSNISIPVEFELPSTAVDGLVRLANKVSGSFIRIGQTDSHILFEIANDVLIATKLQVQFPSINHILNSKENNNMELQVSVSELRTAIKRARITADEETNRISLQLNNHEMTVETRNKMGDTCKEKLNVHWPHEQTRIATNWKYLFDAIQDIESPTVSLIFGKDKGKQKAPIVISEPSFFAVINQLRLEDEQPKSTTAKAQ